MKLFESLHWSDDKSKEDLTFAVKSHEVWRDIAFWQKLLKEKVDLELRLQRSKYIKEKQQGIQQPVQHQKEQREKGSVAEKLHGYVKQMLKLGVEVAEVKGFIEKNSKAYVLSAKLLDDINVILLSKQQIMESM